MIKELTSANEPGCNKAIIESKIEQEQYIEALKCTVKDLKIALYSISQMEDIKEAAEFADNILKDFYDYDKFIKKTSLLK